MTDIDIERYCQVFADAGKRIRETLKPFVDSMQALFDSLEPYQKFEILHPKKKPRGSIRRSKKSKGADGCQIV